MRAITLWQPWATLLATGRKRIETRSWCPSDSLCGQRLAIHAAKKEPREVLEWLTDGGPMPSDEPDVATMHQTLVDLGFTTLGALPRGAILGIAVLKQCLRVEHVRGGLSPEELAFGDYSGGRWAWMFGDFCPFDVAVPARGSQGIWLWDEACLQEWTAGTVG